MTIDHRLDFNFKQISRVEPISRFLMFLKSIIRNDIHNESSHPASRYWRLEGGAY